MTRAYEDVRLPAIADMLENRLLTDSAILRQEGWEERVAANTRPLLKAVAAAVGVDKPTYYKCDDLIEGHEFYDNVHWPGRERLRLTVRIGPIFEQSEVDTNVVAWGLIGYAKSDNEYYSFRDRLRPIEQVMTGFRLTEAPVRGVGGRYIALFKWVGSTELRQQDVSDFVAGIKRDLEDLALKF